LGNDIEGGAITLRPNTFQCVQVWMSNGLPFLYIYFLLYIFSSNLR